jgi:tetratricopeptide (TPR) repeat protein
VVGLWQTGARRRKTIRSATVASAVAIVAIFVVLTKSQVRIWADSLTLWTTVLEEAPRTGTAHANLASLLNRRGDYEGARQHSLEALGILPGNRTAHIALARASTELGDLATAERHFGIALEIRPGDLARMVDLALVKYRLGKVAEAEQLYRAMTDLHPESAIVHYNLGSFLASQERRHEAKLSLEKAVQLDPLMSEAWFRLAVVRWQVDEPAAAIGVLETGLIYAPDDSLLAAKLAWMLATCRIDELRDGPRAVELATQAISKGAGADLPAREALAAALAEVGDFPGAVATLNEVLKDTSMVMSGATRERLELQLDRYRNRTPVRDPVGAQR